MNIKRLGGFLFAIFLLFSCEYELHDNYINLEKPAEALDLDIDIYLDVESDGETIYFSENNNIRYNIIAPAGHKFLRCVFMLGDQIIMNSTESRGDFIFSVSNILWQQSELVCEVYVSSGTGSLADQFDAEYFYGSLRWPVEYITQPLPSLSHALNDEGFLVLSWNKPRMVESNFSCYKVYYNGSEKAVIKDINQASYICESYYGEYASFYVVVEFIDGKKWDMGNVSLTSPEIEFIVDYSIDDSVKISWNNPYNSSLCISVNNDMLASYIKGKTVCIPRTTFKMSKDVLNFSFFSYREEDRTENSSFTIQKTIYIGLGVFLFEDEDYYSYLYSYNKSDNALYFGTKTGITSRLLPGLVKCGEYTGIDGNSIIRYATSVYGNKMAMQSSSNIFLINGKDMSSVKTISPYPYRYFTGPMTITEDDKLICFTYENGIKGLVVNAVTGVFESEFNVPGDDSDLTNMRISSDSRYLVIPHKYFQDGFDIITIENNKVVKTEALKVEQAGLFALNPLKANELFVSSGNKIYIYNCKDLSVINVLDFPGMDIINIDPKTGYLLLYDSSVVKVVNPETKQLLYTLPVDYQIVQLLGNTIVSSSGCVLNLEKYLGK
jgi:hypothetical protein